MGILMRDADAEMMAVERGSTGEKEQTQRGQFKRESRENRTENEMRGRAEEEESAHIQKNWRKRVRAVFSSFGLLGGFGWLKE